MKRTAIGKHSDVYCFSFSNHDAHQYLFLWINILRTICKESIGITFTRLYHLLACRRHVTPHSVSNSKKQTSAAPLFITSSDHVSIWVREEKKTKLNTGSLRFLLRWAVKNSLHKYAIFVLFLGDFHLLSRMTYHCNTIKVLSLQHLNGLAS